MKRLVSLLLIGLLIAGGFFTLFETTLPQRGSQPCQASISANLAANPAANTTAHTVVIYFIDRDGPSLEAHPSTFVVCGARQRSPRAYHYYQ